MPSHCGSLDLIEAVSACSIIDVASCSVDSSFLLSFAPCGGLKTTASYFSCRREEHKVFISAKKAGSDRKERNLPCHTFHSKATS